MKLIPLQQFVCDECGELIKAPNEGWLEWQIDPADFRSHSFRIVHHAQFSPRQEPGQNCYYPSHLHVGDMHLETFLDTDGLAKLLSMLDRTMNLEQLSDIIRRLHIPHYEEARQYWNEAKDDGFFDASNEYWPYLQKTLKAIIRKYGRGD